MLNAGVYLYIFENGRRINFCTQFDKHPMWQNNDLWRQCIHRVINVKFANAVQSLEIEKLQKEKEEKESGFFGSISKIFSDDKPIEFQLKGTLKINKTLAQQIVFNSHQDFIAYYTQMRLTFDQARENILYFCKKYELDQQRTHLLLHDLEAA